MHDFRYEVIVGRGLAQGARRTTRRPMQAGLGSTVSAGKGVRVPGISARRQISVISAARGSGPSCWKPWLLATPRRPPFLHGTLSLPRALNIMEERRHLYTNWLVRWPLSGQDAIINLSTKDEQQAWLLEEDGDTELLLEVV